MREFVIGDIHGCSRSLSSLLKIIQPGATDTFIFLGDYIDRGPDSCAVLDAIIELNRNCTVIPIAGNHEKMLLQSRAAPSALQEWLIQGGRATLESYARPGFGQELNAIPKRHWEFLNDQILDYWETDQNLFVHASLDPALDMDEQPAFLLFWQPFSDPTNHKSGKQIICGHTSQKSGWPAVFDGGICIDTHAYGGGWLTCFEIDDQKFIQTNERGERRSFDLQSLRGK
jgi:serine/threonine protein phosphatase 1